MKLSTILSEASSPKVVNLKKYANSAEDLYGATQTSDSIKDGDVLDCGGGNLGIMVKAWPVVAVGEIDGKQTQVKYR